MANTKGDANKNWTMLRQKLIVAKKQKQTPNYSRNSVMSQRIKRNTVQEEVILESLCEGNAEQEHTEPNKYDEKMFDIMTKSQRANANERFGNKELGTPNRISGDRTSITDFLQKSDDKIGSKQSNTGVSAKMSRTSTSSWDKVRVSMKKNRLSGKQLKPICEPLCEASDSTANDSMYDDLMEGINRASRMRANSRFKPSNEGEDGRGGIRKGHSRLGLAMLGDLQNRSSKMSLRQPLPYEPKQSKQIKQEKAEQSATEEEDSFKLDWYLN